MPLQEIMQKTTFSEFQEWLVYLEIEDCEYSTLNTMLAQLAAEIRRSYVKHPENVNPKMFMPRYSSRKSKPPRSKEETEEQRKVRQHHSKAYWSALLGV